MQWNRTSISGLLLLALGGSSLAAGSPPIAVGSTPTAEVRGSLPTSSRGVSDLKFRDMYTLPVGPRGLEPTPRLLGLHEKRVRMVGYMVRQEAPAPGQFLLAPIPVALGDEDDSLADDLPPNVVLIETDAARGHRVAYRSGLMTLIGVLHVGARAPASLDGRVFGVSLSLDAASTRTLLRERHGHRTARTRIPAHDQPRD